MSTTIGPEEYRLLAALNQTIEDGRRSLLRVHDIERSYTTVELASEPDPELDQAKDILAYFVKKAFRDVAILAERLTLPLVATEVRAESIAQLPHFRNTDIDEDGDPYSQPLRSVIAYLSSIESLFDPAYLGGLDVFRTILENTARIIDDANLEPQNESQVRSEIYKVLRYGFREVEREIERPKEFKTYRMDIGIKPLRAVAEYKFIDSESEARNVLDGIYADMRGYGGYGDWSYFFAVLYQTHPFITQAKADHELKLVRADLSWQAIVVTGPGARAKKN